MSLPPEAEINPHEVDNAIALLKLQGHSVEPYDYAGTILYKIDGYMLITTEEISELCKRVCTIMDAGSQSDVRECH